MAADDGPRTDRKDAMLLLAQGMPPPAPAVLTMDVQTGNTRSFVRNNTSNECPLANPSLSKKQDSLIDTNLRQFSDRQPNILQRRYPNTTSQQANMNSLRVSTATTEEKDRQREQRINRMKQLLEHYDKSDCSQYKKRLSNMTASERNNEARELETRQKQLLKQEAVELKRMMELNIMSVGPSQVNKSWSTFPKSSYETP